MTRRSQGQSQRNQSSQSREGYGGGQWNQGSQQYGQGQNNEHQYDYEGMQMSRSPQRGSASSSFYSSGDTSEGGRSRGYRDTDSDLAGSSYGYGSQGTHSLRDLSGMAGGYSDYETNERNRGPSRYSSFDDDKYFDKNYERYGTTNNRTYGSGVGSGMGSQYGSSQRMGSQYGSSQQGVAPQYGGSRQGMGQQYGQSSSESAYGGDELQREHFGKGPKGYKRSDERIKEDVCETLARNPKVDASDIEVKVEEACVVLSGAVKNREEKRAIEMAIENLYGVEDVKNEIKVKKNEEKGADSGQSSSGLNTGAKNIEIGTSSSSKSSTSRNIGHN